jgi:hypothetical protein
MERRLVAPSVVIQEMPMSAREILGGGEGTILGKKLNLINYVNNAMTHGHPF